ncbi:Hypothetical protein NTJ_03350 [Nesidiocoris tenuis]|uniref:Uncharacterized protein n=1 Tax=Nesidiocoris tenuis TaxID=355587 RepID=A0ABN7AGZ2_9HEMI|nr:Hypothetical protein NTJ_03350 [Nesidiocoris tenuis]
MYHLISVYFTFSSPEFAARRFSNVVSSDYNRCSTPVVPPPCVKRNLRQVGSSFIQRSPAKRYLVIKCAFFLTLHSFNVSLNSSLLDQRCSLGKKKRKGIEKCLETIFGTRDKWLYEE